MSGAYKNLIVSRPFDGVAVMSFNRPAKLNSWSRELLDELLDFLRSLQGEKNLRAVILRGEGEKAFSTGADFRGMFASESDRDNVELSYQVQEDLREIIRLVREAAQVFICECHGYAVGGGFFLAMASDIRLITEDVKFSAPLLKMSMSCGDCGSSWMLPRLIGSGAARDILLTGRYMEAKEAMRLGFASECFAEKSEMDAAALERAKLLASYTPHAIRYSKELLNIIDGVASLDDAIRIENRSQQLVKAINRQLRDGTCC